MNIKHLSNRELINEFMFTHSLEASKEELKDIIELLVERLEDAENDYEVVEDARRELENDMEELTENHAELVEKYDDMEDALYAMQELLEGQED